MSEQDLSVFVMQRDASFWNKPNVTSFKKYHLISDKADYHGFHKAKCNRNIRLLDDSKIEAEAVKFILCKKCFANQ